MALLTRRAALAVLGAGGGLLGVGYILRNVIGAPSGQAGAGMMGDMSTYMEMFNRHDEFRRAVEDIPGGVRTTTETDSPELVAQLQAHVSAMYARLDQRDDMMCMSDSLPTLFRRAPDYQRQLAFTSKGVVAVETTGDPDLTQAIRAHAREVTGFVVDGMPAMMKGMMQGGMMGDGMMGSGR